MTLNQKFQNASQFLGAYFPDADFDSLSDEDVVRKFLLDTYRHPKQNSDTLAELRQLLLEIDLYWEEIAAESNVYFKNEQGAQTWILSIIKLFEKYEIN